ncbi:glycerol dehydrogenase [Hoeflea prorocentri]|uniref:Glycerol dehydrogenase n=1 Tax=Hoeflea prorocentri TaxID=1922333 RepID=A0A9X3UJR2_9HYPH|nr:glycerol dehydrogenase [Hoeflea prorocentri]MCY6381877.1 glycerol dehydrogenase [Hoeflea prorocentri]MDA5399677.1 glycerol dehydrogenase [Hoeflea prorocentri]
MKTSVFPSRYVQGAGALARFSEEAGRFGNHALALMDANLPDSVLEGLGVTGDCKVSQKVVKPACTPAAIEATTEKIRQSGADIVAGFGGGKVIDLGRAAADVLRIPFVSVPTVAASDAPCSALAVIYDEEDRVLNDHFVWRNPDLVLVDSAVICAAPARFLSAGIGDALATFYECNACINSGAGNLCGGTGTQLAYAAARLCLETVIKYGEQAVEDCKNHSITDAFERVLEANILLSGIGFESGGVGAAHAFHNGISELPEVHHMLHGEKVAFGVLAELALNNYSDEEIVNVARFCKSVDLPVSLGALGINSVKAAIPTIATRAIRPGEIMHNEPMTVTQDLAEAALFRAQLLGSSLE